MAQIVAQQVLTLYGFPTMQCKQKISKEISKMAASWRVGHGSCYTLYVRVTGGATAFLIREPARRLLRLMGILVNSSNRVSCHDSPAAV